MAELVAVQEDTLTPIQLGVLVDGRPVTTDSITSATLHIGSVSVVLTVDDTINRLTGTLPGTLTETPGTYTGYVTLVTNTGTYRFPDLNLTLIVLDSYILPSSFLGTEILDFLVTESLDYLILESP